MTDTSHRTRRAHHVTNTDALYYPYINIRDVDWLKATLLCFPHVLRMVPVGYLQGSRPLNPLIERLHYTTGSRGRPLLGVYDLESQPIAKASLTFQHSLEEQLERDGDTIRRRFSQSSARDYGRGDDSAYQLHDGKISHFLGELLRKEGLMWRPDEAYGSRFDWWAMHPLLAEALMSSFADAAARDAGCEVVTDEPGLHYAVSEVGGDGWLKTVADRWQDTQWRSRTGVVAQLVIMNTFNVSTLSLENLEAMSREEDALHEFRSEVACIADTIPDVGDPRRMEEYIEEAAERILEQWSEHRRKASSFSRLFFGHGLLNTSEKAATDMFAAMLGSVGAGAAASGDLRTKVIAAAGGLAVGLVYFGARRLQERRTTDREHPLRYLSLVQRSGSNVALSKSMELRMHS